MESWQYIEVLKKSSKKWFFSKDNSSEKIDALIQIAINGDSSMIYHLVESLKDDHVKVRQVACNTIIQLFKKIDGKKGYYNTLKHCSISLSDLDFYESNFSNEDCVELFSISSLNGNGRIRQKATKMLSEIAHPRAIQFLIYRLADWVLPVRQEALNGLKNYFSTKYSDALIANLPIFDWLQDVERIDLSEVHKEITAFILDKNRAYILENFKKYPDKLRLLIGKHISDLPFDRSAELRLFLADKHFLIRNLALNHFAELGNEEISSLLNDKSGRIRILALYHLKSSEDFENIVRNYLADDDATIRNFSRYSLKGEANNFVEIYHENLKSKKHIIGSLYGLSELEAIKYSETVKGFLDHEKIKVRKVAFLALRKLDEKSAYQYALANINSPLIGIRNLAINYLADFPRSEVLERARNCYETEDHSIKKAMLKLFAKIGGWAVIPDLMMGTIENDEILRDIARRGIEMWKKKAIKLFSSPDTDDLERAKQVFEYSNAIHESKKYFKLNPIEGLEFYFR